MAKKSQEFQIGEEIISYLRHSVVGMVPIRVKIDKIIGIFGRKTYVVSNDVGAKFPTRTVKKLIK